MATIKNVSVEGFKVGIIFPANADLTIEDVSVTKSQVGLFGYESSGDISALMNTLENNDELFKELITKIESLQKPSERNIRKLIGSSSIAAALGAASDSAGVIDFLIARLKDCGIL